MPSPGLNARERLLEVMHILETLTDSEVHLSIHDIHSSFPEGTKVSVGAIRDDLIALEESIIFPVTAVQEKNGLPKHYYYDGRPFEIHELRLLMDAISAAKFISKNETNQLLMKIRKLTSKRLADQLKNELFIYDPFPQRNEKSVFAIQQLHTAIHEKRLVSFQYGRYNTKLQFSLSKEGQPYFVEPLGLVWNNDRYYLVANYLEENEIRQYRLDRMRNVQMLNDFFVPDPSFNLHEYTSKMFHMFGGEMISLEAEFNQELLNMLIDRFGVTANIKDQTDGTIRLKAQVVMSEGLVRWLLRWGADVKVLHPQSLVQRMKEEITKMYDHYQQ